MSIEIRGLNHISDIFSIFHDGGILICHVEKNCLLMEIEILYLAERIHPDFQKFSVRLFGVKDIQFSTWPKDLESQPKIIKDINAIFKPELEIMEGRACNRQVQVVCNQHSSNFDYCGGELSFTVEYAEVTDEAGKHYSVDDLSALAKGYWDA